MSKPDGVRSNRRGNIRICDISKGGSKRSSVRTSGSGNRSKNASSELSRVSILGGSIPRTRAKPKQRRLARRCIPQLASKQFRSRLWLQLVLSYAEQLFP